MLTSFNPNMWYKLTNASCGPEIPLDVVNDNGHNSSGDLKMAAWGSRGHSGQHWQFRPHDDNDGTYRLCTWFLGTSKSLDVYTEECCYVHLAEEHDYSGQKWRVMPWLKDGSWDGTYKLRSEYSGEDKFLDTKESSRRLFMGDEDSAGMHWTIEPIMPVTVREHMID